MHLSIPQTRIPNTIGAFANYLPGWDVLCGIRYSVPYVAVTDKMTRQDREGARDQAPYNGVFEKGVGRRDIEKACLAATVDFPRGRRASWRADVR